MDRLRILVTGGSGFVGSTIVQSLAQAHPEWRVSIVDLQQPPASVKHLDFYRTNVTDADGVLHAVQQARPNVIVHAAGIVPTGLNRYSRTGGKHVFELNVGGTGNILSAAKSCNVQALVLTSSSQVIADDLWHEYPNMNENVPVPASSLVYGESKAMAERLVLAANSPSLATCALRPSVIFGPGDYQLIPAVHACIAKREMPWIIGSADNLYDFTSVFNVAHAHVLAVENLTSSKTAAGEAIFISNDQPITFRDFCLAVWAGFGHAPAWEVHIPQTLAWVTGYLAELASWVLKTPTTLCRGSVLDASTTRYADLTKARTLLGYIPQVELAEGIRASCEYYAASLRGEGRVTGVCAVRPEGTGQ